MFDKEDHEMRRIIVINHLTLDGVMQAPGRPDEDTRGGFTHGGWAMSDNDHVMSEALGERMQGGPLLLGRRSYEDMLRYWNSLEANPFAAALNAAPKYVASTHASTTLEWPNSTLLYGDIPAAVGDLKDKPGGDIAIMGSGELIQSLAPHNLIDEYLLMIHPLILGSGRRLFPEGTSFAALRLVNSAPTTTGVIIATYQPVVAAQ
jgi:dihydrofolate reductase